MIISQFTVTVGLKAFLYRSELAPSLRWGQLTSCFPDAIVKSSSTTQVIAPDRRKAIAFKIKIVVLTVYVSPFGDLRIGASVQLVKRSNSG